MKKIRVDVDIFKCGGGIRQDRIRRFLQSNGYGIICQFIEDEVTYSMDLFIKNPHETIIELLVVEFPEYSFKETE